VPIVSVTYALCIAHLIFSPANLGLHGQIHVNTSFFDYLCGISKDVARGLASYWLRPWVLDMLVHVAHANGGSIHRFPVSLIGDVDSIRLSSVSNPWVASGIFRWLQ